MLWQYCRNNLDFWLISETKLDSSFPDTKFNISGYTSQYRLDRNKFGGGLLLYVIEDIPSKIAKAPDSNEIAPFYIEINLRNKKNGC